MTTEGSFTASASPAAFRAAIAVLSHGRRLPAATVALLHRLMAESDLPRDAQSALLAACETGLRPAEADAVGFAQPAEALVFLTALTQFALRVSPNWREALHLPELVASRERLPYDVVHRMASRLGPDLEAIHADRLEANLRAFLQPGEDVRAIAAWIGDSLHPPAPDRRSAAGVPTSAYQHPLDVQAIDMVRGFAGFDELTRLIFEHGIEKMIRVANLSSAIRVGPDQFPELYAIFRGCVDRAGVTPEPELYVCPGGLNAHTSGVDRPYVMLEAGAVSSLSRAELEYVIGHELGHIRCQHLLYLFMASYLPMIAKMLPVVGGWVAMGLNAALGEWARKAELSCDRMGLLVSQDLEACLRVMVKCSGAPGPFHHRIDLDAFLRQAEEFRALDRDMVSALYKFIANMDRSHPWTVERAYELKRWHDEGGYAAAFEAARRQAEPTFLPRPTIAAPAAPEAEVIITAPAASAPVVPVVVRLDAILAELETSLPDAALAGAVATLRAGRPGGPHRTAVIGEQGRGKTSVARRLAGVAGTEVLDTPSLNAPDGHFDEGVVAAAVRADVVLVVLSAAQLLTERERALLRDRLLPTAGDRVALVVTRVDLAEDDADRQTLDQRVARFLRSVGREGLPVFWLDGSPEAPTLVAWLEAAVAAHDDSPEAWHHRSLAVLAAVQAQWGLLGAGSVSEADRRGAVAWLRARHRTALAEAEAHLAGRLAALKLGLPVRLAAAEGPALVLTVQRLGHEASRAYRDAFTRALMADAPAETREALAGFQATGGPMLVRHLGEPEPRPDGAQHPSLTGLTAIGAGLLVFTGGAMPILGALALGTAHEWRSHLARASEARSQDEAAAALAAWFETVERELVTQLRASAEQAIGLAEARVLDAPEPEPGPGPERVRALIRDAMALTRDALADGPSEE
ncbi:heat shock protein HtpX [compost metagenome]